jgi:hypothetical protein
VLYVILIVNLWQAYGHFRLLKCFILDKHQSNFVKVRTRAETW